MSTFKRGETEIKSRFSANTRKHYADSFVDLFICNCPVWTPKNLLLQTSEKITSPEGKRGRKRKSKKKKKKKGDGQQII